MNRFSNFKILGKSTDINTRNLSYNETFIVSYKRNIKNANNPDLRKKVFEAYSYFRNNFPKASAPTGEVAIICKEIINLFFSKNIYMMRESFANITDSQLYGLSVKVKDLFKRMTGINNTVLCFDKNGNSEPIKVFLDIAYDYLDEQKFNPDPLAFKIENGFFKFSNNPERINLTIIINFDYIKTLINKHYTTTDLDPLNPEAFENSYTFSNNYYLKINDIIDRFWKDLLGAFTLAIYKDRYREAIMAKIYTYFYLLEDERKKNYQLFFAKNKEEFLLFLSLYKDFIKKSQLEVNWIYPNLHEIMKWKFFKDVDFTDVSPIDFYNALFEPTQIELSTLRAKLRVYQTLDPETNYTHLDGIIDDLNMTYNDDTTNLAVSVLLVKRLLPVIIFVETFINEGNKYIELKNFINKFEFPISQIEARANYNVISKGLLPLINNIKKDKALISNSRTILVSPKLLSNTMKLISNTDDETLYYWSNSDEEPVTVV